MTAPVVDPHPELYGREFSGFRVGEYLGQGGSGPVYAGTMLDGGARVAIKVFDIFGLLPEPVRRAFGAQLEAEAGEASRILHPSVAQVLAVGAIDEMPCVVSEFVEGERLDVVLERNRAVDEASALAMLRQVATGVQVIHASGLVHGDVKPGNVIVRSDGIPVLVDLGHAKSDPRLAALTRMGRTPGTPLYQPPEQVEGEAATIAGDVFGLGATLLALVTGPGSTPEERKQKLQSEVSPELRRVILTAMAKAPADRFASAEAVISGLDEVRARDAGKVDRSSATVLLGGSPPRRATGARPKPPAVHSDHDIDDDIETLPAENIVSGPDEATISDVGAAASAAPPPRRKTGAIRRPTGTTKRPDAEPSKPKTERAKASDVADAAAAQQKPRTERVKASEVAAAAGKTERAGRPGATGKDKSRRSERPGRPAKRGGAGKLVGALLVLALLGGGGFAAWHFTREKPAQPEVAKAPKGDASKPAPSEEGEEPSPPSVPPSPAPAAAPAPAPVPAADPAAARETAREAAAAKALAAAQAIDVDADLEGAIKAFVAVAAEYDGTKAGHTAAARVTELTVRRAELAEAERVAALAAEARAAALASARAHLEALRYAEAREALARLPDDTPGLAELRVAIDAGEAFESALAAARAALDGGDPKAALERLEGLAGDDPRVVELRSAAESALAAVEAEAAGRKAESALADAERALREGRLDAVQRGLRAAEGVASDDLKARLASLRDGADRAGRHWREARDAAWAGRNREAEQSLAALQQIAPGHEEASTMAEALRDLPEGLRDGGDDGGTRLFVNVTDESPVVALSEVTHAQGDAEGEPSEAPGAQVRVGRFYVDRYEVTNRRYGQFLDWLRNAESPHAHCHADEPSGKDHTPAYWSESGWSDADLPVVGVDWYDAYAYARWAGLSLPTEAQWEAAARGGDQRRWPWGDEADATRANCADLHLGVDQTSPEEWEWAMGVLAKDSVRTRAPGSFPEGRAPCGADDMAGNVWEWCLDTYRRDAYATRGSSDPVVTGDGWRVLRGGSWYVPLQHVRAANRWRLPAEGGDAETGLVARRRDVGFRCVRNVE